MRDPYWNEAVAAPRDTSRPPPQRASRGYLHEDARGRPGDDGAPRCWLILPSRKC